MQYGIEIYRIDSYRVTKMNLGYSTIPSWVVAKLNIDRKYRYDTENMVINYNHAVTTRNGQVFNRSGITIHTHMVAG